MGKKFRKNKKTIEFDGESLQGYINKLDNHLKQQDRIKLVEELLVKQKVENEYGKFEIVNDFIQEALTMDVNGIPIVNVSLTTSSNLSEEETFFVQMQRFANYILYAPDAERIDKKVVYNFYTESQFKKVLNKEKPISEFLNDSLEEIEVIDFLVRKQPNFKKSKRLDALPCGWQLDEELEPIIEYEILINTLTKKIKKLKEILENNEELSDFEKSEISSKIRKYRSIRNLLYTDQLDLYTMIKRPIYLKQVMSDSCQIDWTEFDFNNPQQVKALLGMSVSSTYNDFRDSLIIDLYRYVKSCKFEEDKLEMINMMQKNFTMTAMSVEMDCSVTTAINRIGEIVDRIIYEYQLDNENYIKTFLEKGEYKKCDGCGCNILISEIRQNKYCSECEMKKPLKICNKCGEEKSTEEFSPRKESKDGLYGTCKSCVNTNAKQKRLEEMLKKAGIV